MRVPKPHIFCKLLNILQSHWNCIQNKMLHLLVLQVYSYLPDSSGLKPSYLEDVEVKSACHDSRFHVKTMQVLTFHIMWRWLNACVGRGKKSYKNCTKIQIAPCSLALLQFTYIFWEKPCLLVKKQILIYYLIKHFGKCMTVQNKKNSKLKTVQICAVHTPSEYILLYKCMKWLPKDACVI